MIVQSFRMKRNADRVNQSTAISDETLKKDLAGIEEGFRQELKRLDGELADKQQALEQNLKVVSE